MDDQSIKSLEKLIPVPFVRYTHLNHEPASDKKVLILDTMGMLSGIYHYGDFALIGGGFKDGIHSILEPASFSLPLFFGPHHKPFPEAEEMIQSGGAFEVSDRKSFETSFLPLFENENNRTKAAEAVRSFINNHKGASACISDRLISLFLLSNAHHIQNERIFHSGLPVGFIPSAGTPVTGVHIAIE